LDSLIEVNLIDKINLPILKHKNGRENE